MKTTTKYVADDGREFNEADACQRYEQQCAAIAEAVAPLGEKPNLPACGFENGHGYLQHDADTVESVRQELLAIAREAFGDHKWITQSAARKDAHPSWVGRLIGDSGHPALNRAWHRIMCIDGQCREWGQPFYAMNPDQGGHVELKPGQTEWPEVTQ